MVSRGVLAHLKEELAKPDPWRLAGNPFEQQRYELLWSMLQPSGRFASALEIGCAAGLFTERLVTCCESLRVIDLLPEAIARCRTRLGRATGVTFAVADISEEFDFGETYDLVVISEVLYYLGPQAAVRRAIRHIVPIVRPGGVVLFGSATDATVRRWGFSCGAETAMREFSKTFVSVQSRVCEGKTPDECALLVSLCAPAVCSPDSDNV